MRLIVTETNEEHPIDVVTATPHEFNGIALHLYMLSNNFDEVIVELSDWIQLGKIRPLMSHTRVIPKIPEKVTSHTISLLTEMYPEKAAELRYTFMRDPSHIKEKIDEIGKTLNWADV